MGALNTINFHLETFFTDLTTLRDRRVLAVIKPASEVYLPQYSQPNDEKECPTQD